VKQVQNYNATAELHLQVYTTAGVQACDCSVGGESLHEACLSSGMVILSYSASSAP
jgi:hypothetical protein